MKREIILKARQEGFSTLIAALYFLDTVNNNNTHTMIIAHDAEGAERLFGMFHTFYENLPPGKKLTTKYSSKTELYFADINSRITVGTAGSKQNLGRSGTFNNVHASEAAFWPNGSEIIAGLFETVPMDGNIFIETTANGMGNFFYSLYHKAMEEDSAFSARFFPWFMLEEYQLAAPTNFQVSEEENRVQQLYNLTDDQIFWRRLKEKTLGDKFEQEYPSNVEEAFLLSGQGFFSSEALQRVQLDLIEHPEKVAIPREFRKLIYDKNLKVFARAQSGKRYVIGADVAEGIDDRGDHDYSVASVFDYESMEQVAVYRGRIDPNEFGKILYELGYWYNVALICVERNNHGHSTLNTLYNHLEYPLQKPNEVMGLYLHDEFDGKRKQQDKKLGFPTSVKSKALVCDAMQTLVEDGSLIIRDFQTWAEMRSFSKLLGGKLRAESGSHDDTVLATALACYALTMRYTAPRKRFFRNRISPVRSRRIYSRTSGYV